MKVLNLYAGIGGNRKLWEDVEVTAVELDPDIAKIYQDYFPLDTVIVGDAHQYLLDHFKEFDFIWSSPPCITHSRINKNFSIIRYPEMELYQEVILLDTWFKGKYCVENVIPYYEPIIKPSARIGRHIYWANFPITSSDRSNPKKTITNFVAQKTRIRLEKNGLKRTDYKHFNKMTKQERNQANSDDSLYILNCARNIITKQNEKQIDLFL